MYIFSVFRIDVHRFDRGMAGVVPQFPYPHPLRKYLLRSFVERKRDDTNDNEPRKLHRRADTNLHRRCIRSKIRVRYRCAVKFHLLAYSHDIARTFDEIGKF